MSNVCDVTSTTEGTNGPSATAPRVNLDSASGLPLHPVAHAALLTALDDGWADPGRVYGSARRARLLLDASRQALAAGLGARPDEVFLSPNGVAAAYAAVRGVRGARARLGAHVVHSAVEHSAVLHACAEGPHTSVGVDRLGRVAVDEYVTHVQPDTVLGCLLAASHEVGTRQPVTEVATALGALPLLVDASHAVGRASVPAGWSLLTASAEHWGGPVLGLLAVRTGTRWRSPWPEDEHEPGAPGRVALPSVVAAAAGLQAVLAEREAEDARLRALTDRVRAVAAALPDVEVVGDPVDRLPHLVTFSCLYVDGEALVHALDSLGFEVSSGSSCTSSTLEPSHVLVAMGVLSHGNARMSLARTTTAEDVDRFLTVLPGVIADLRAQAGAGDL